MEEGERDTVYASMIPALQRLSKDVRVYCCVLLAFRFRKHVFRSCSTQVRDNSGLLSPVEQIGAPRLYQRLVRPALR